MQKIITLTLFLALFAMGVSANAHENSSHPNVVLIFIDDMGWGDFSCFGNKDAETPNIDAIASEGIAFEQFYVNSPICSPSRVAISTGTYPQRWKITSYLSQRWHNDKRGVAQWLDPKAPMLARALKKAGYATGHFGKWHMGGQRDVTEAPQITEYGFDESLTNFEGLGPKLLPMTKKPDGKVGKIWGDAVRLGKPVTWMQRSEITGGFTKAALAFIAKAQKAGKPFYINLWPDDVHSPYWPPIEKWGDGSKRRLYLSVLEEMDKQFGKLFKVLKSDPKLRENTILLICSDNGPEPNIGRTGPLRGYKTFLYEGGVRSPLVVWAPGLMKKSAIGTRNKTSVIAAIDLTPSLITIAGAKPQAGAKYDGEDLAKTLLGETQASRKKTIFFSRPPDRKSFYGTKDLPDLALREGKWKFLCDYDGGRPELYDILRDPGESTNLAKKHPEVVKKLTKDLLAWFAEMP